MKLNIMTDFDFEKQIAELKKETDDLIKANKKAQNKQLIACLITFSIVQLLGLIMFIVLGVL